MDGPIRAFGALSRYCCYAAGWALMLISFATVFEIFSRKFLGYSFKGLDEIGGYMLAGVSAFGFAYTLSKRSHMRVTLLFPYISPRAQAFLNVLAMVTLAAMAVFCAWRGIFEVQDSLLSGKRSNTPLQVPVWIPQAVWLAGMALFAAGAVMMALHSFQLLFKNQPLLNRLYGPQSLEEEISTEVELAESREGLKKG